MAGRLICGVVLALAGAVGCGADPGRDDVPAVRARLEASAAQRVALVLPAPECPEPIRPELRGIWFTATSRVPLFAFTGCRVILVFERPVSLMSSDDGIYHYPESVLGVYSFAAEWDDHGALELYDGCRAHVVAYATDSRPGEMVDPFGNRLLRVRDGEPVSEQLQVWVRSAEELVFSPSPGFEHRGRRGCPSQEMLELYNAQQQTRE